MPAAFAAARANQRAGSRKRKAKPDAAWLSTIDFEFLNRAQFARGVWLLIARNTGAISIGSINRHWLISALW